MMNAGRMKYDAIPVPEEVDAVIWNAMLRGQRQMRKNTIKRWLISTAAVFAFLVVCANVAPVYTYAAQIPVLGSIVRVLHVGSGGKVTDGAAISARPVNQTTEQPENTAAGQTTEQVSGQAASGAVLLTFDLDRQALANAPFYTVSHLQAPNRVNLQLSGVRKLDFDAVKKSLMAAEGVADVYQNMTADDSSFGIVIVMKAGYTDTVTELQNPAGLSFSFRKDPAAQDDTVYFLRSGAMEFGEELSAVEEFCMDENPTQVKLADGTYFLQIGNYSTKEEAEKAWKEFTGRYGTDPAFRVDSCKASEVPEK